MKVFSMTRLKLGLIGAGVFGGYHARKIAEADVDFIGLCDRDARRAETLAAKHGTAIFATVDELLSCVDAVIIATPAASHYALGKAALIAGCHVLIEKPLALESADALELADLALASELVLQVGHQERLVCDVLGLADIGETPHQIDLVREGPAPKDRRALDVSVVWDLMIHDIDLVQHLLGTNASNIVSRGISKLGSELDDVEARLEIDACAISLKASRIAPAQRRLLRLVYEQGEVLIDLTKRHVMNSSPHALSVSELSALSDPLGMADQIFFSACRAEQPPLVTGHQAASAVALAERLQATCLERVGA